ncbi:ATP-binding protein [Streptomyces buecherae]|uniref:ATP-binding protein n=1 Tax=Streptomyces buecherae TaxID=2763006 RepID=UPI0036A1FD2B
MIKTDQALVVAPPTPAPPGTPVVIYACLPPASPEAPVEPPVDTDRVIESVRRYVAQRGWVTVREFVDYARVDEAPLWSRTQFQRVMTVVETGSAAGIVTPSMGMVAASPEEEAALAEWQRGVSGSPFLSAPVHAYALRPQERRVPAEREAVGKVRAWVTECLRPLAPGLTADAVLCVDELVANAVQHAVPAAGGPAGKQTLTVTMLPDAEQISFAVDDPAPELQLPELPAESQDLDEGGRGLFIVASLAERWGACTVGPMKRVWCSFRRDAA